jgi:hypothetical protein
LAGGLLGGVAGGIFGTRTIERMLFKPIRNSSSLRARCFGVKIRAVMHASFWLSFGYLATTAMAINFFGRTPVTRALVLSAFVELALYAACSIALIPWASRVARRIIEEDMAACNTTKASLESSSLSLDSAGRTCRFSLVLSVLCSVPVVLMLAHVWWWPLWLAAALFILLWHTVFFINYRRETAAAVDR